MQYLLVPTTLIVPIVLGIIAGTLGAVVIIVTYEHYDRTHGECFRQRHPLNKQCLDQSIRPGKMVAASIAPFRLSRYVMDPLPVNVLKRIKDILPRPLHTDDLVRYFGITGEAIVTYRVGKWSGNTYIEKVEISGMLPSMLATIPL